MYTLLLRRVAFTCSRAKVMLKYVVLANMLALSDINPFDSREAKVYQVGDPYQGAAASPSPLYPA